MKANIYMKLAGYFAGLIFVTCAASGLLFFVTLGRPVAKEAHQLIRNHVRFIAAQAEALVAREEGRDAMQAFIDLVSDSYGMRAGIFDAQFVNVAGFPEDGADRRMIGPEMIRQVREHGIFVQSGHFSGRTVYLIPLNNGSGQVHYLYISRVASSSNALVWFVCALGVMCLFLMLGIYPLAKSFTRPIRRLSGKLELMASGRFRGSEGRRFRSDELGRLEDTFEKMAGSVNEMMASKKQLLADISHELRSPLGRMEVSLELLSEAGGDTNAGARHIRMLEAEIQFMTGLIRSLSQYSKINLPEFRLALDRVSPGQLVRDAFSRNRAIMEKQGVDFSLDLQEDLPGVRLDQDRIFRVLQNLLDNARQHCPAGGRIVLGAAGSGETVRFSVSDTGPGTGLTAGDQDRIFDPLFRADASRNRHTGGIGLGLAISRRIVELHNGRIWYGREQNRTIFSVELGTPQQDIKKENET